MLIPGAETNVLPNTDIIFLKMKTIQTVDPRKLLSGHKSQGHPCPEQGSESLTEHFMGYFEAETIFKRHSGTGSQQQESALQC